VFWKRSNRDERRQRVLDELFVVKPAERRERLDRAVAAGEVRADEVESTLRLVERLDALRVFTIPNDAEPDVTAVTNKGRVAPDHAPIGAVKEGAVVAETQSVVAAAEPRARRAPRNGDSRTRRKRVAVPVLPDTEAARPWLDTAVMPLDALEAASRLVARDRAAHKPRRGVDTSSGNGLRAVMEDRPETQFEADAPVSISIEPAQPAADENWPSIAWLRP
jgi:hypothetical protein